MKHFFAILFILLSIQGFAQEDEEIAKEKPKPKAKESGKFDWEQNFYLALSSTSYLDIVRSPLVMVNVVTGQLPDNTPIWKEVPFQTLSWSLFSLGIEPRVNIKTFSENHALALSIPFAFGLSQSVPVQDDIRGADGFGSVQIPLYVKMYFGHGSTYESDKDFGVSFGAGMEFNKIALLPNSFDEVTAQSNKGWVMPVFTLGIHFWRMSYPMEINLKYGAGAIKEYYVDGYGEPLKDANEQLTSRSTRSASFKLSFVYLMNY